MLPICLSEFEDPAMAFPFDLSVHRRTTSYPLHRHTYLEFTYVTAGCGMQIINGERMPMVPGTFSVILPYQFHGIEVRPGDSLTFYNCSMGMKVLFANDGLGALLKRILLDETDTLPCNLDLSPAAGGSIECLLADMLEEYHGDRLWRETRFRNLLAEVMIRFDRSRREPEVRDKPEQGRGNPRPPSLIWQIAAYVFRNYQEDLTLQKLAAIFHANPAYISAAFRQTFGENFHTFLQAVRIRHACALLQSSDAPITDIAGEAGFASYSAFSRTFRAAMGASPAEYRKRT